MQNGADREESNDMAERIDYGYVEKVDLSFAETVQRVRELLKGEGFGILCEIDVSKTLKEKAGVNFQPYLIFGACNPQLAHKALSVEAQLGLLLPCNVVVQVKDGSTVVSAVDAVKMLQVVGNPKLREVALDANERLQRVMQALAP
jgi:uncharacterized protein (DUF302 family)